jgi:hypothetical protein
MPLQTRLSNATVNGQADSLARRLDNGYLRIYSGAQPGTADTAIAAQELLAELRFSPTSAPAAVAGVLTFNPLTSDVAADATGTATWFRTLASDGVSVVLDGSIGITGSVNNLELATTSIVQNAQIQVTSFTHTVAKSSAGL